MKYRIREETNEGGRKVYTPQIKILWLFWLDYFWWGSLSTKTGLIYFFDLDSANQAIADHKEFLASTRIKQKRYIEVSQ